jgi:large subunit ribosomal protein L13e
MKHNNMLPNAHFRKDWHFRVQVKLNQAARKLKRSKVRKEKAAKIAPRPAGLLRPAVRCPTQRYNAKVRVGRGFTLEELKGAGVTVTDAKSKGVAVDFRRRNKSVESLNLNVQRLKSYLARVVVNPKKDAVQLTGVIAKLPTKPKIEGAVITAEMKNAQVVRLAKQAESTRKLEGRRRWAKKKEDAAPAGGEAQEAEE